MNLKETVLVGLVVAGAVGFGVLQMGRANRLEKELAATRGEGNSAAEELESVRRERDELAAQLKRPVGAGATNPGDNAELMRLRAQVARLSKAVAASAGSSSRSGTAGSAGAAAGGPGGVALNGTNVAGMLETVVGARITQLREILDQNPAQKIPEISLATEEDWKDVVKQGNWENSEEALEAFKTLRTRAKTRFAGLLGPALRRFAANNGGNLPNDLSLAAPYFDPPVDPSILARYSMLQSGSLQNIPPNQYLVQETSVVDPQHDAQFSIGLSGYLQGPVRGVTPRR